MAGPRPEKKPESTLIDELAAFCQEHHRCGELNSGVEGDRVWLTCTCGAVINRHQDD